MNRNEMEQKYKDGWDGQGKEFVYAAQATWTFFPLASSLGGAIGG